MGKAWSTGLLAGLLMAGACGDSTAEVDAGAPATESQPAEGVVGVAAEADEMAGRVARAEAYFGVRVGDPCPTEPRFEEEIPDWEAAGNMQPAADGSSEADCIIVGFAPQAGSVPEDEYGIYGQDGTIVREVPMIESDRMPAEGQP